MCTNPDKLEEDDLTAGNDLLTQPIFLKSRCKKLDLLAFMGGCFPISLDLLKEDGGGARGGRLGKLSLKNVCLGVPGSDSQMKGTAPPTPP